jgi:hypothetical protein
MQIERKAHVPTKLSRAREIRDALEAEMDAFFASAPFSTRIEREGSWTVLRLGAKAEPPLRWSAMVGDMIHNLRSCLDVAVYQLVEQNSGIATEDHGFPMSKAAHLYPGNADKKTAGIHSSARLRIDAAKPYPGGNDDLRLVHTLDIEDKHHLLLALAAGADQGLAVGPSVGGIQAMQPMSRAMSKHLFPLIDGSVLIKTDRADNAETVLGWFTFFPFIALKPDGRDLHEDVFVIFERLWRATCDVIDGLLPAFDLAPEG